MKSSISVRELAEFVHRSGDINHRLDERLDLHEGLLAQHSYQARVKSNNDNYQTEKVLRGEFTGHGVRLKISGRADGVVLEPGPLVEEIKASRIPAAEVHVRMGSVHMAQARIYAAMLLESEDFTKCSVQLTYVHPDSLQTETIAEEWMRDELQHFLNSTVDAYTEFLSRSLQRVQSRNQIAKEQPFPFTDVGAEQLRVARRAYVSMRDEDNLMLEAPTGTGKTMATLYPSVKAMGQELIDRVYFATARTTGQRIAIESMRTLQAHNEPLTTISITAKERICFTPGATCAPEHCEYAKGHYDRLPQARKDLLARRTIGRKDVELVARVHRVCPYELSLDATAWVDVAIGDYNYIFDPMISLRSLQSKHFRKVTLLVDEAHRLGERVADMLSVRLEETLLEQTIGARANSKIEGIARGLLLQLNTLANEFLGNQEEAVVDSVPEELWSLATEMQEALLEVNLESTDDVLFRCLNTVSRLVAAKERFDDKSYAWFVSSESDSVVLRLRCVAPGSWIRKVIQEYKSSIRFSGTLSPPEVYTEHHGLDGPFERARIDPDPKRYGVVVVPDISTYWRDRQATAQAVVDVAETARESTSANWLVTFPSFEYLDLVYSLVEERESVRRQQPVMDLAERAAFIDWVNSGSKRAAFVSTGGVFAESVDFASESLAGVIVVGPAIPPKNLERELVRDGSDLGYELAYRQPALTRVVQAAGRVVRHGADRGAILLIDPRFTHREVKRYFPQHWLPKIVKSRELRQALAEFWRVN